MNIIFTIVKNIKETKKIKLGPVDPDHIVRAIHLVSLTSVMPQGLFQPPASLLEAQILVFPSACSGPLLFHYFDKLLLSKPYSQTCFRPMWLTNFWTTLLACVAGPVVILTPAPFSGSHENKTWYAVPFLVSF